MILRNEEVNILANLPLWAQFTAYFVFLVDHRTTDNTITSIQSTLSTAGFAPSRYVIKSYEFDGFGSARSLSLHLAYSSFPQASHVMIADPDWRPRLSTIDMNQLHDQTDVFRFVVYDRNGVSRRRMDWMLKHRPDLQMKYSLHEVLDIGYYNVSIVSWIFDEIERTGSWHTAVGHGSSMTARRYLFDLDLLNKDLIRYNHDPHVHYYLGITYHAHCEYSLREGLSLNQTSLNKAIYYLTTRLQSTYSDEFIEERWAVMYILGGIFTSLQPDLSRAMQWFTACRDYNPRQVDCSLILTRIHIGTGRLHEAWSEMELALQQDITERAMLNMLGTAECELPALAVRLLTARLAAATRGSSGISGDEGEGMLLTVLVHWLAQHQCNTFPTITELTEIRHTTGLALTLSSDELAISCSSQVLHVLLRKKRYRLHPCHELAMKLAQEERCLPVSLHASLSSTEAGQWKSELRSFTGAAFIDDMNLQLRLLSSTPSNPFRVLFAVYFKPAMVLHLLASLQQHHYHHYEITVLTNDSAIIDRLTEDIKACLGQTVLTSVVFLPSLQQLQQKEGFDLIEFNGGLSMLDQQTLSTVLHQLQQLLKPRAGLLTATAFMHNHLRQELKQLLNTRDTNKFLPFSLEARRSVVSFLTAHGLSHVVHDEELMLSLGAEPYSSSQGGGGGGGGMPVHKVEMLTTPPHWYVLTISQATEIVKAAGLSVSGCWPRLVCHPFGPPVRGVEYVPLPPPLSTMATLGFDSEVFVEQFLPAFRFTLFLRRQPSASADTDTDIDDVSILLDCLSSTEADNDDSLLVRDRSNGQVAAWLFNSSSQVQVVSTGLSVNLHSFLTSSVVTVLQKLVSHHDSGQWQSLGQLLQNHDQFIVINKQEVISALVVLYQLHWISFQDTLITLKQVVAAAAAAVSKVNHEKESRVSLTSVENQRLLALGFPSSVVIQRSNQSKEDRDLPRVAQPTGIVAAADSGVVSSKEALLSELSTALWQHAMAVPGDKKKNTPLAALKTHPFSVAYEAEAVQSTVVIKTSANNNTIVKRQKQPTQPQPQPQPQQQAQTQALPTVFSLPSHRQLACTIKPIDNTPSCQEKRPLRRRTAGLKIISTARLDILAIQLRLLREKALVSTDNLQKWQQWRDDADALTTMTAAVQGGKVLHEITQAMPLNRLLYIHSSPTWRSDTTDHNHKAVLVEGISSKLITAVSKLIDNDGGTDFAVLDHILSNEYLQAIRRDLTLSTIYFDSGNGYCAVAHGDDGLDELVGPRIIFQELLNAIMTEHTVEIMHISAIAFASTGSVDNRQKSLLQSPLFEAGRDEIMLVLWLDTEHPAAITAAAAAAAAAAASNGSGIRLFSTASSDCLTRQGTIVYPSYHPDFLSQRASLNISLSSNPCLGSALSQQEWIPAVNNRLVLVNSRRPVVLEQMMTKKKNKKNKKAAVASGDQSSSLSVVLTARVKVMSRQ